MSSGGQKCGSAKEIGVMTVPLRIRKLIKLPIRGIRLHNRPMALPARRGVSVLCAIVLVLCVAPAAWADLNVLPIAGGGTATGDSAMTATDLLFGEYSPV